MPDNFSIRITREVTLEKALRRLRRYFEYNLRPELKSRASHTKPSAQRRLIIQRRRNMLAPERNKKP